MRDSAGPPATPGPDDWVARTLSASLFAFAVTTGALLVFATHRGSAFAPYATVGARVSLDAVLPPGAHTLIGLAVHAGESLALGALVVILSQAWPRSPRVVTALTAVVLYEIVSRLPWIAVLRADLALPLTAVARAGLALLLVVALSTRTRRT